MADLVSLIGAVVLWYLTVGSVRNFAFFLGLSTLIDLVVAYFFTRPAVLLLARTQVDGAAQGDGHRGRQRGDERPVTRPKPSGSDGSHDRRSTAPRRRTRRRRGAARAAGCTTARPRSTSTAGGGGASASPALLIVITVVSLFTNGLNLGIDFEGGVAVGGAVGERSPIDEARAVLDDNGVDADDAKIAERQLAERRRPAAHPGRRPAARGRSRRCSHALADGGGRRRRARSAVNSVSSSWGREHHREGVRALVIFLVLVAAVHRLALRVADGARRDRGDGPRRADQRRRVLGASASRSRRRRSSRSSRSSASRCTTRSSCSTRSTRTRRGSPRRASPYADVDQRVDEPGADALAEHQPRRRAAGAVAAGHRRPASWAPIALREFALALLVGLITGSYSSIFIAAPLLAMLKEREPQYRGDAHAPHATGAELERLVLGGSPPARAPRASPADRRRGRRPRSTDDAAVDATARRARPTPQSGAHPPAAAAQEEAPLTPRRARSAARRRYPRIHDDRRRRRRLAHASSSATSPTTRTPGVTFRDITPLLGDADAFRRAIDELGRPLRRRRGRPGARHRGPRLHPRRAGRLPDRGRLRAGAQGGQAAVGGRPRGVQPRVRHRQAGDPPRRHPPRRAGPRDRRRARHRRHGGGHLPAGRGARRRRRRPRLPDRDRRPRRAGQARRAAASRAWREY